MQKGIFVIIGIVFSLALMSCQKHSQGNNLSTSVQTAKKQHKFFLITDVGGVHDQSFSQGAWEGLEALAKQYPVKVSYMEPVQASDRLADLTTVANGHKVDIIWAVGFVFKDAIKAAAQQFPKQKFGIVDYSYPTGLLPNVVSITFKVEQSSFLAGYLAALTTKTNKVGFIGGVKSMIISQFQYGYWAGLIYGAAQKKQKIHNDQLYIGSFTDVGKAKASADIILSQGADVICAAAGPAGDGNIAAAQEHHTWAIGVDRDQYKLAPHNILTSIVKNVGNAIAYVSANWYNKQQFSGGKSIQLSLKNNMVELAPSTHFNVPPKTMAKVNVVRQKIIDGKIQVPATKAQLKEFIQKNHFQKYVSSNIILG